MSKVRMKVAWAGDGTARNPYRPLFADHYKEAHWAEVGQADPTKGGEVEIEIEAGPALLARIASDARYRDKVRDVADGPGRSTER